MFLIDRIRLYLAQRSTRASQNPSLTRLTLTNLSIRMAGVFIVSALLTYGHIIGQAQLHTQEQLQKYVTERGKREEAVFQLAADRHALFKQAFAIAADQPRPARTLSPLYAWSDGTHRNFPQARDLKEFDSISSPSIFVGRDVPITAALKRQIRFFESFLLQYAVAWRDRFVNTYLISPDNIAVTYWVELPGPLIVPGDFDVRNEVFFYLSDRAHNPQRRTAWTKAYQDPASPDWIVSVVTPIDDANGNHIATVGHDLILNDLIERTNYDRWRGTYNLIVSQDGELIAHPDYTTQIAAKHGTLKIDDLNDAHLSRMFALIRSEGTDSSNQTARVLDNHRDREYIAVTQLSGPDWYFVTVYPKSLMQDEAWNAARFILLSGGIALLIEIAFIYSTLRQQVTQPLTQLLQATQQLSDGNFQVNLPELRQDELGQLSNAFNRMSNQLQDSFSTLEDRVTQRTRELQAANQALERLSRLDGLTQVANRRYFDEYLTQEWQRSQQEQQSFSLILCDVDYFKRYNDRYGHQQGDACLQQVAKQMQLAVRGATDCVARYGGEEFAVILPNTSLADAIAVAQRIQTQIQQAQIIHHDSEVGTCITLSFGVASVVPTDAITPNWLVALADRALYAAKQQGRDRIVELEADHAKL